MLLKVYCNTSLCRSCCFCWIISCHPEWNKFQRILPTTTAWLPTIYTRSAGSGSERISPRTSGLLPLSQSQFLPFFTHCLGTWGRLTNFMMSPSTSTAIILLVPTRSFNWPLSSLIRSLSHLLSKGDPLQCISLLPAPPHHSFLESTISHSGQGLYFLS